MDTIRNGFWDYVARWRETFKEERRLHWERNWIENDYCKDCRFCCGPQDSCVPFPMALMPKQLGPDNRENFHMLDNSTAFLAEEGCLADANTGCRLRLDQKPVACGLFPVVLANGALYLYQNCPAVIFSPIIRFLELGREAAVMLLQLSYDDLLHLSIWLNADTLARSYIDLRIRIFDEHGKNPQLS